MNRNLHKAIAAGLGILALAGVSTQASAQSTTYAGTISGSFSSTFSVANYAWDGHNNPFAPGLGWGHNTRWVTFSTVATSNLDISLTTSTVGSNPAFSLWKTTGYTNPADVTGEGHTYSQVSTQSKSGWLTDPAQGGVTSIVGYANAGPSFSNYYGSAVGSGSAGSTVSTGSADLKVNGLAAGDYLIALGGSNYAGTKPGSGSFNLDISVAAVPEPEEYLMMLLGAGMVGFQVKRKKAKQAA